MIESGLEKSENVMGIANTVDRQNISKPTIFLEGAAVQRDSYWIMVLPSALPTTFSLMISRLTKPQKNSNDG